ncbi:MAG: DUF2849 domain-containing protein [Hyphomonas sp.]|nr:DUF2849 domain-containing protein [Hyphomonas sp.]
MARPFVPKIITANDLLEGDVIYLTADGSWSRAYADALVATSQEEADALLNTAEAQADRIVGAYFVDTALDENGKPKPDHFREVFRATGPSNYHLGKQAEA